MFIAKYNTKLTGQNKIEKNDKENNNKSVIDLVTVAVTKHFPSLLMSKISKSGHCNHTIKRTSQI